MATFVLIHGGGDSGWYWHLVEPLLRARGHDVVAPDLSVGDQPGRLEDFVDSAAAAVETAVGEAPGRPLVAVGHSFGGITAPLVVDRLGADVLAFVTGMVPVPGAAPGAPPPSAGPARSVAMPALPDVPTRFVLCTEDRFFPPAFMGGPCRGRLPGVVPDEIAAGHCVALSLPEELAELLDGYAITAG